MLVVFAAARHRCQRRSTTLILYILLASVCLQGVGKTTACGKLALLLRKREKKVLMVATDVYRPAAIDQLVKLGQKIDVPVFELGTAVNPVEIARRGIEKARELGCDAVIVDTAGRLQIDTDMMDELKAIKVRLLRQTVIHKLIHDMATVLICKLKRA